MVGGHDGHAHYWHHAATGRSVWKQPAAVGLLSFSAAVRSFTHSDGRRYGEDRVGAAPLENRSVHYSRQPGMGRGLTNRRVAL